jgi:benzoyl-CoA reductase/2-hydroxyglutaryl-CoA dehydratase subunit BcrC/BadD/HgdB
MDGHPDSLQALREEIEERLSENWRAVRLRLLPSGCEHESLRYRLSTCKALE